MSNVSAELAALLHSNLSELFYTSIGSTWPIDSLYMFAIGPLALVGLLGAIGRLTQPRAGGAAAGAGGLDAAR